MSARATGRSRRAPRIAAVIAASIGVLMTGCAPTGADLFEQAKTVNITMKEEIAELQLYILDGEWDVDSYGEIPEDCGSGYTFAFRRSTLGSFEHPWRLPQKTPIATAEDLVHWLDEHGWTGITPRTYTGGVTSVTVTARKPDVYIDDLLITATSGPATDVLSLRVTGACQPGDKSNLRHFMFPDGLSGYSAPQVEHPTAKPFFGSSPLSPTPSPRPEPFNPLAEDPLTPIPTP